MLWVSIAYLLASFCVTMTWYFPQLDGLIPRWVEQWIYPINKTDFDILRFAHFLALAALAWRFVPDGWPGLQWRFLTPLILCGQHSLQIFCLGVALAFAGYAFLTETSGGVVLHVAVGLIGVALMSAMASLLTWYKHIQGKGGPRWLPPRYGELAKVAVSVWGRCYRLG